MKSISKVLLATILFVSTSVCSLSPASAQYKNFKVGDRVEAMFGGRWQPGTVMPLLQTDTNQTGSKLRIMLDSMPDYLQPGGTEIMAEDTRAGGAAPKGANGTTDPNQSYPGEGASFKPGDRVEAMFNGKPVTGTVMPLSKFDTNRTGSKLRVMIDSMPEYLQHEGSEIMTVDVKHSNKARPETVAQTPAPRGTAPLAPNAAAPNNPGTTFKPGDRVEATWNGRKVTGTVVPLLHDDLNKTGTKIRVKIDGLADYLQPDGTEIMTVDAKHTNAGTNHDKFANGLPAAWNPGTAPLPAGGAAPAKPPRGAPAGEYVGKPIAGSPKMIGNVPDMSGTGWKMLYDRAVSIVPTLYFRKTGRYETVGVSFGMQGGYQQNGSKLLLIANGKTDPYNMTYDPVTKILRLDADGDKLKLLYDGPAR